MALQKMVVVETSAGTDLVATPPYQFYAQINGKNTVVVNILMPLGGKESGLYRYPRPGESVMTDKDRAGNYYLIGYIPTLGEEKNDILSPAPDAPQAVPSEGQAGYEENAWNAYREKVGAYIAEMGRYNGEAAALQEGLILRYEQTGKVAGEAGEDERYSELGFYTRETQWKSGDTAYKSAALPPERNAEEGDEAYSARLATEKEFYRWAGEGYGDHIDRVTRPFPKIDLLNLQSTGDMRATAKNHQLLKAKRFELLVNCDETIHHKETLSKDELPLGDNVGDDSQLHAGDAHIRAANRVVIKAEKEIILQVGKSALKISDDALDMISKIVNSNFTNAYDATFNMSKDGITMFGREMNITADKSFGIADTFGGSVGSELGVVSIGGREIKAEVYDSVQYSMLVIYAIAQYVQSISSASMGINGNVSNTQIAEYIKFSFDTLKSGAEVIKSIVDVAKEWAEFKEERDNKAVESGKKADEEAQEAKEKAKKENEAAKQKAADDEEAENRKTDLDKAKGKITEEEAEKRKADSKKTRTKAEADADATLTKANMDADTEARKKKSEAEAVTRKKQIEEETAKTKKQADDDLLAGKITPEKAKALKEEADKKAARDTRRADLDNVAKKVQADRDAEPIKTKADNDAKATKTQADQTAKSEKNAATNNAKKRTGSGISGKTTPQPPPSRPTPPTPPAPAPRAKWTPKRTKPPKP
ncbi:MAG: hypothetical protein LBC60_02975 [Spirochaetaceae bacterium]|jgi:hypothetical protein|nr:hypothetical protein [Spirochaetaceae bacterium]